RPAVHHRGRAHDAFFRAPAGADVVPLHDLRPQRVAHAGLDLAVAAHVRVPAPLLEFGAGLQRDREALLRPVRRTVARPRRARRVEHDAVYLLGMQRCIAARARAAGRPGNETDLLRAGRLTNEVDSGIDLRPTVARGLELELVVRNAH